MEEKQLEPERRTRTRLSRAEQSAASSQAILQAALTCFSKHGSKATSMEDIAREAGVSRTLVHYHFKTKDDLFLQVQLQLFRSVSDRIQEAAAKLGPSPERAGWALDEIWGLLKQARPFFPMFLDQLARSLTDERLKPQFRKQIEERRTLLVDGIRSVLTMTDGKLDAKVPAIADLIMAAMTGLPLVSLISDDLDRAEAAYQEFKALLLSLPVRRTGAAG